MVESVQVEDIKFSAAYENSIEAEAAGHRRGAEAAAGAGQQEVQAKITVTRRRREADLVDRDRDRQRPGGAARGGGRGLLRSR